MPADKQFKEGGSRRGCGQLMSKERVCGPKRSGADSAHFSGHRDFASARNGFGRPPGEKRHGEKPALLFSKAMICAVEKKTYV